MKKIFVSLMAVMLLVGFVPAPVSAAEPQQINMDQVSRITVSGHTTGILPANVNGNQETVVYRAIVGTNQNGNYRLTVNSFTNKMDTVNVTIRVGGRQVGAATTMRSGERIDFNVGPSDVGSQVTVTMSTNASFRGSANITLRKT